MDGENIPIKSQISKDGSHRRVDTREEIEISEGSFYKLAC